MLVVDIITLLRKYLPADAKLVAAQYPLISTPIQTVDLDNDGQMEIILAYQWQGAPYLLILKRDNNQWRELGRIKGPGYGVNYLASADITGDGRKEILIGWQIGAIWNQLDIYFIRNGRLEKIASKVYSRIELIAPENHTPYGGTYIALWSHVTGEAYDIEVYGWKNNALVPAENVYPYYFRKVVLYYMQKVKEMPGAAFYWYYLADAQIKARMPQAALYSIDRGMALHLEYPSKADFLALRKKALAMIPYL